MEPEFTTWEDAARAAAYELLVLDGWSYVTSLAEASDLLKEVAAFGRTSFAEIFCFALAQVSEGRFDEDREVVDGVVTTIISKQNDYGHGNILRHGLVGIGVRMDDKIARIQNLESRGVEAQNESLADSYRDLMGYSIIGWMFVNGTFELPLAKDVRQIEAEESDKAWAADLADAHDEVKAEELELSLSHVVAIAEHALELLHEMGFASEARATAQTFVDGVPF